MSRLQRVSTTLLIVATTTGATFTILFAGGSGSLESLAARVIYDAMAAIAIIPWLAVAAFRPCWLPSSRLMLTILLCLAVFATSTLTSRIPRLSLEMLGYSVLLVELYILLVALMRRPALRLHLERLSLAMCALVCVLYLIQAFQAWLVWWELVGRVTIPPLRPGYLGLSLGAPIPIATLVLLLGAFGLATTHVRERANLALTAVIVGLVSATVLITASRGAWIGTAAGVAITLVTAVLVRPMTRAAAIRTLRSRWGPIAVVIGAPILAAGLTVAALSGRLTLEDSGFRAAFASASLQMFSSSPITGTGPGTWQVLRAANTEPSSPDLYIPHAHNIYVQIAAEFGVVGLVAAVMLVAAIGLLALRTIQSGDEGRRRVAYAAIFAVVLLAVQELGDMLMNVPALLFAMALPVAWLDATSQPPLTEGAPRELGRHDVQRRVVPAAALAVTCAILIGLVRVEGVTDTAGHGVAAANSGSWLEAVSLSAESAAADPDVALYHFQLGVSAANAGDLALAEASLARSANEDDYTYAWLNLAAVRWKLGDADGARDALGRAERLGLQRMPVAVAAGWLHQQLGDEAAAIDRYAKAVTLHPTLADDPFWSTESGPPGGVAQIIEAAYLMASPDTRLQIDLIRDRPDLASDAIDRNLVSDPGLLALVVSAWNGDAAGWAALQSEAADRPLDATAVSWARLVASHRGDQGAVDRYGTWLSILGSFEGGGPLVARIIHGSAQPLPPTLLDRYGSLYRRRVPAAQVVAILPQIRLQNQP